MRLWAQLSLLISGLLLAVILSAIAIIITLASNGVAPVAPPQQGGYGPQSPLSPPERAVVIVTVVGLFSVTVVVLVSRTVTRPISQLAASARRIGAGDLAQRTRVRGSKEMMELSAAFNAMAADLQGAEELRSNLIADVSHELRTPLTVLEGNLRAALDHVYALDEATIADLYGQVQHLIHLVNDLRELALADARQLPLHKRPTDLAALLDETYRVFLPLAEDQEAQLALETPPLPAVDVDADRIRQVLHNLVANALRYTPVGGKVTLIGVASDNGLTLQVKDTGVGLSAEQQAHIFDRFYRGDASRSRATGGAGLGLAIVKAIVEAHGGTVSAASVGPGAGATFTIFLPR